MSNSNDAKRLPFGKRLTRADFMSAFKGSAEMQRRFYDVLEDAFRVLGPTMEAAVLPVPGTGPKPATPPDGILVPVGASGATVGSLVSVTGGSMKLASYTTGVAATHIVAAVSAGLATCVVVWNGAMVKIAGTATADRTVYVGTKGNGSFAGGGEGELVQEVGNALYPVGGSGLWYCSINIPNPRLVP